MYLDRIRFFREGILYLGNVKSLEEKYVDSKKITHIVHCTKIFSRAYSKRYKNKKVKHLVLPLKDSPKQCIIDNFEKAIEFMSEAYKKKSSRVLVHCAAGVSRSSTILIAFLMYRYKKGFRLVLDEVKKSRSCVLPNLGFSKQLEIFERSGYKIPVNPSIIKKVNSTIEKNNFLFAELDHFFRKKKENNNKTKKKLKSRQTKEKKNHKKSPTIRKRRTAKIKAKKKKVSK